MSYITFVDSIGRNILGEVKSETSTVIEVLNPVLIIAQPNNNQLQIQLVPLFFAEFIKPDANGDRNFAFIFNKVQISIGSEFEVEDAIVAQYRKIIDNTFKAQPKAGKTVKLFDDV